MTPGRSVGARASGASTAVAFVRTNGLAASASAAMQVLSARWQLRKASAPFGVRVRGRVLVQNRGVVEIGNQVRFEGTTVRIELVALRGGRISVGERTYINYGTNISATKSVRIGNKCAIGQYCIIMDNDYHRVGDLDRMGDPHPVVIGDRVWLGARVIVLPGSTIGDGSVIGANSVVKGDIPAGVIAAGMPARVIRRIEEQAAHG